MLPGKGWLARLLLFFTNGRQRVIVDAMAFYTKYNTPRCTGTYVRRGCAQWVSASESLDNLEIPKFKSYSAIAIGLE